MTVLLDSVFLKGHDHAHLLTAKRPKYKISAHKSAKVLVVSDEGAAPNTCEQSKPRWFIGEGSRLVGKGHSDIVLPMFFFAFLFCVAI